MPATERSKTPAATGTTSERARMAVIAWLPASTRTFSSVGNVVGSQMENAMITSAQTYSPL